MTGDVPAALDAAAGSRYGPTVGLLVVDVQNDFADPKGSLAVRGGADVVPAANIEIDRAQQAGATVVYTQDWHPARTPHLAIDGGVWPVHCVQGSWGAQLHPELVVRGPVVRKGANGEDGYSGFTMRDPTTGETVPTELASILEQAGVTSLLICGLATDYCVRATALDGIRLGYTTAVLEPAIRAVNVQPGDGERALAEMLAAGVAIVDRSEDGSDRTSVADEP